MNVSLVMFKADGTRRDFPLTKDRVVVGRKNDCDLRIPLTSVSRQHCELRLDDQTVRLKDLGSSNGTYHNNTRVQEATLSAGDEIIVGPVVFTVVIDGHPAEIQPVRTIVDHHAGDSGASPQLTTAGTPQTLRSEDSQVIDRSVEAEQSTPTVDLDDPIAALEAMAREEEQDDEDDELKILGDDEDDDN